MELSNNIRSLVKPTINSIFESSVITPNLWSFLSNLTRQWLPITGEIILETFLTKKEKSLEKEYIYKEKQKMIFSKNSFTCYVS